MTRSVVGGTVHVAATGPPPLSVVHAVPVNYNLPPPAVPLAAGPTQLSYVTIEHMASSTPAPADVVCCL